MGVSGSGKSTIGGALAKKLNFSFYDGDDYHPKANIEKMASGIPLEDNDRIEWLQSLNKLAQENEKLGAVIACSALKESYRKLLQRGLTSTLWVVLEGSIELITQRIQSRKNHFMPVDLLKSQFATLEVPSYGIHLSIDGEIEDVVSEILKKMKTSIGLVGLGVMGTSLARNIARNGYSINLYNRRVSGLEEEVAQKKINEYRELSNSKGFEDLKNFIQSINRPRKIILLLTAGAVVDEVLLDLRPLLDPGDILLDCGNSFFEDSQRRFELLKSNGIHFLGVGVSGGEEGALKGPSMMPGGDVKAHQQVASLLEDIAAKTQSGEACTAYMGEGGAGHFVKMVHNGIEYAEMQLLAEIIEIAHKGMGLNYSEIALQLEKWNLGDLQSYLLESSCSILREKDDGGYILDRILDKASHKGTGSWSAVVAAQLGQPATMINAALNSRFISSQKNYRSKLSKEMSFSTSLVKTSWENLEKAYRIARIVNHHQGLSLIREASTKYQWSIDLSSVVSIWREGCIIASALLYDLQEATKDNKLPLSFAAIQKRMVKDLNDYQNCLKSLLGSTIPTPCLSEAYTFYLQITQAESSASMIQAQRDYFGAHGFELKEGESEELTRHKWTKNR